MNEIFRRYGFKEPDAEAVNAIYTDHFNSMQRQRQKDRLLGATLTTGAQLVMVLAAYPALGLAKHREAHPWQAWTMLLVDMVIAVMAYDRGLRLMGR